MFTRIVVPLDGTRFAEAALAPARELAHAFNARILVVRAVQRLPLAAVAWHEADELTRHGEAHDYLRRIVDTLRAQGYKADLLLRVGEPAAGIAWAAERDHADVIVMAAHPHWRMDPLSKASTTLKVLARTAKTRTPILAWRAAGACASGGILQQEELRPPPTLAHGAYERPIEVALDGSPFAERALAAAETLARTFDRSLVLTRAIQPATRAGAEGEAERAATDYLQRMRRAAEGRGVGRVVIAARHGTPLSVLDRVRREFDAGLIVLASHGRGGFGGTFLGSTAARLIEEVEVPVLVVRAEHSRRDFQGEEEEILPDLLMPVTVRRHTPI